MLWLHYALACHIKHFSGFCDKWKTRIKLSNRRVGCFLLAVLLLSLIMTMSAKQPTQENPSNLKKILYAIILNCGPCWAKVSWSCFNQCVLPPARCYTIILHHCREMRAYCVWGSVAGEEDCNAGWTYSTSLKMCTLLCKLLFSFPFSTGVVFTVQSKNADSANEVFFCIRFWHFHPCGSCGLLPERREGSDRVCPLQVCLK